ncbi:MAG: hypothetical protein OXU61_08450, partial [Gammaproteobacteria bacterium]|nr:hypothetical protein [Gammaproteobacteria bacterium]
EDIRTIARNPKYKQLLNELVESHRSADGEANEGKEDDDSSTDEGSVADPTAFEQQTGLVADLHTIPSRGHRS